MKKFIILIENIVHKTEKIVEIACLIALFTMIILTNIGVFYRYVLHSARPWIPEVSRFLLVFIGVVGGALAIVKDDHVSVSVLYNKFPEKLKFLADIISIVLFGYISYVFVVYGFEFAQGAGSSLFAGVPLFYPRMFVSIAGVLMLIFLIGKFKDSLQNYITKEVKKE